MKILCVIVLYNQNYFETATFKTFLSKINESIFIYDNSLLAQHLKSDFKNGEVYIHDKTNAGISFAYNYAADFAKKNGFDRLLLLDQDTSFPSGILDAYKRNAYANHGIKLIVPLVRIGEKKYMSPTKKHWWGSRSSKYPYKGMQNLFVVSPINSGMFIDLDAFFEVGGYNEKVRLDYSDYQFIERLRKKYPYFYVLENIVDQNYSAITDSNKSKIMRYILFCQSLRNYETDSFLEQFSCFIVTLKRAISLAVRTKRISPFEVWYKNYLK